MLTLVFNWIYILFTCFCLGMAFAWFVDKTLHYTIRGLDSILGAGLLTATVYAQVFSLLGPVGLWANLALLCACLAVLAGGRKRLAGFLREALGSCSLPRAGVVLVLVAAWSYFASRGYRVPDMDLYHGQSIRWIEEYGVVKGLGNFNGRIGYNSSMFALSALYSMKFLLGHSLHGVNGFMALLLSVMTLKLGNCFRRRRMLLSDYARAAAVYYLTTIWDEIIAPSSDYAVMLTIFFIVIKWLELLEEEDPARRSNAVPYGLLCVAGVYALTLKLTAGLILIFLLKPAYLLLSKKQWKEIGIFLAVGLAVALPWMTRTVLITGWLFYPFPELDLFQVDWKMSDVGAIRTDAYQIKIWAKGANRLEGGNQFRVWFPNWFANVLQSTEKLLILADISACALVLAKGVLILAKRQWDRLDRFLVLAAVAGCYLFWQFSAPMMRYGYAHVLLLAALTWGCVLERFRVVKLLYLFLVLYGLYKMYVGCVYISSCWLRPNYVWQETYESYDLESFQINGVTLYYSPIGDGTGYDPFPSSTSTTATQVRLRGDSLKDGFLPPAPQTNP